MPTTLAIMVAAGFDNLRERATAIGAWTAIGAAALALGPLIGGFISQHFHWGWIFFINVPVGVITLVLALAQRDRVAGHQPPRGGSTCPAW